MSLVDLDVVVCILNIADWAPDMTKRQEQSLTIFSSVIEVLDVSFAMFIMFPWGCFLKILLNVLLLLPLHSIRWCLILLVVIVAALGQPLVDTTATASRQCTTGVQGCHCLKYFWIFVCVSWHMYLLSVSKFCLCQSVWPLSVSKVIKSLPNVVQSRSWTANLNRHKNPARRHNRYFNIAIAQRTHEAMHIAF